MSKDTYAVELTFRQWMSLCYALGHVGGYYKTKDMTGEANRYNAINDEIATQLSNE